MVESSQPHLTAAPQPICHTTRPFIQQTIHRVVDGVSCHFLVLVCVRQKQKKRLMFKPIGVLIFIYAISF
jgi:hypothetical protein